MVEETTANTKTAESTAFTILEDYFKDKMYCWVTGRAWLKSKDRSMTVFGKEEEFNTILMMSQHWKTQSQLVLCDLPDTQSSRTIHVVVSSSGPSTAPASETQISTTTPASSVEMSSSVWSSSHGVLSPVVPVLSSALSRPGPHHARASRVVEGRPMVVRWRGMVESRTPSSPRLTEQEEDISVCSGGKMQGGSGHVFTWRWSSLRLDLVLLQGTQQLLDLIGEVWLLYQLFSRLTTRSSLMTQNSTMMDESSSCTLTTGAVGLLVVLEAWGLRALLLRLTMRLARTGVTKLPASVRGLGCVQGTLSSMVSCSPHLHAVLPRRWASQLKHTGTDIGLLCKLCLDPQQELGSKAALAPDFHQQQSRKLRFLGMQRLHCRPPNRTRTEPAFFATLLSLSRSLVLMLLPQQMKAEEMKLSTTYLYKRHSSFIDIGYDKLVSRQHVHHGRVSNSCLQRLPVVKPPPVFALFTRQFGSSAACWQEAEIQAAQTADRYKQRPWDYLDSEEYVERYGSSAVWTGYRRNHKGGIPPQKTRKTCIRGDKICGNPCPICRDPNIIVHRQNVKLLQQFISPHTGMMYDPTLTGVCMKQQKKLNEAINKARDDEYVYYEDTERFDIRMMQPQGGDK
ncbi:hypothetical protein CCH79_00018897, partial [Gambusia affinis]